MKELLGVIEYALIIYVPGHAAKILFDYGHTFLGILVIVYALYMLLYRLNSNKK